MVVAPTSELPGLAAFFMCANRRNVRAPWAEGSARAARLLTVAQERMPIMVSLQNAAPKTLRKYFVQVFQHDRDSNSEASVKGYKRAMVLLIQHLGYDPKLSRLSDNLLDKYSRWCTESGVVRGKTAGRYKTKIKSIRRHALPRAFHKNSQHIGPVVRRPNSLLEYAESVYFAKRSLSSSTKRCYLCAIKKLCTFMETDVTIGEVTPTMLRKFAPWLYGVRPAKATVDEYVRNIKTVFKEANPVVFEAFSGEWPKGKILRSRLNAASLDGLITIPDPTDAEEGTLRHFLHTVYVPYRMTLKTTSVYQLDLVVALFDRHLGRPSKVEDLTDDTVVEFMHAGILADKSPKTVNNWRTSLLTLWRHAWRKHYTETQPRDVPRLREPARIIEAWSAAEVGQLLAACEMLAGEEVAPGVSAWGYWDAMIRFAWDTGLRRGDVRRVRWQDVDEYGLVTLVISKTGFRHVCEVRPSTLEALRKCGGAEREFLFPWPACPRTFCKQFNRLAQRAGLEGTFKYLRRGSASSVKALGGNASDHLGHRTPGLFERNYEDPRISRTNRLLPPELGVNEGGAA